MTACQRKGEPAILLLSRLPIYRIRIRSGVMFARLEPRRHAGGRPDVDPASGASGALVVAVRLNGGGCMLRMSVAAAATVRELCRAVAQALGPVAEDVALSWNCARLAANDGRALRQVGMVDGSVVEGAFGMRGGMQGAAESAGASRGRNEQVRQWISKVQSIQSLVEQAMTSIPGPIASGAAAAMESSGRAASALRGPEMQVISGGGAGVCEGQGLGVVGSVGVGDSLSRGKWLQAGRCLHSPLRNFKTKREGGRDRRRGGTDGVHGSRHGSNGWVGAMAGGGARGACGRVLCGSTLQSDGRDAWPRWQSIRGKAFRSRGYITWVETRNRVERWHALRRAAAGIRPMPPIRIGPDTAVAFSQLRYIGNP